MIAVWELSRLLVMTLCPSFLWLPTSAEHVRQAMTTPGAGIDDHYSSIPARASMRCRRSGPRELPVGGVSPEPVGVLVAGRVANAEQLVAGFTAGAVEVPQLAPHASGG